MCRKEYYTTPLCAALWSCDTYRARGGGGVFQRGFQRGSAYQRMWRLLSVRLVYKSHGIRYLAIRMANPGGSNIDEVSVKLKILPALFEQERLSIPQNILAANAIMLLT